MKDIDTLVTIRQMNLGFCLQIILSIYEACNSGGDLLKISKSYLEIYRRIKDIILQVQENIPEGGKDE